MSTATKITVEQYSAMIDRGDFEPPANHRVELIRGEIVLKNPEEPMSPANKPHKGAVIALTMWSADVIPRDRAVISVQIGFEIANLDSVPEPDIAWLALKDYDEHKATADDVLLVVEVSDSSLGKYRKIKAPLYAEASIRDYWIANIRGRCIEVFRDPEGGVYRDVTTHEAGGRDRVACVSRDRLGGGSNLPRLIGTEAKG